MSVQEILTGGGGLLLVLMTLIQVAPVKINPWSWLAKAIGKAMGLDRIEKKLDAHIEMDDRRTADGHRARILHFNNELLRDIDHTKEEFTEVLLETLSIVAYKQPVTRLEIEKIRGVNSDHALNRLVEYGLVGEAGRLDAPGRPILFGTTEEFLRNFGVRSKEDLPSIQPELVEEMKSQAEEEVQLKLNL